MNRYVLFSARHEVPINLGHLCDNFDFSKFEVIKSEFWQKAINDSEIELIVTGLTPALTQFISEKIGNGSLILLHFNKESNNYISQKIF